MKKLHIHNVRLGHATNSSSTHSIVILPNAARHASGEQSEFGWDHWTAADRDSKLNYLAIALHDALSGACGDQVADAVTEQWVGKKKGDGYIDHQSRPDFPAEWNGKGVDKEFFADFSNFILRDDVAILGGNDNDSAEHPLLSIGKSVDFRDNFPIEDSSEKVARKDGSYWTIFNRATGAKMRVSFSDDSMAVTPTKASAPELVDVKITDHCPVGCRFCYQNSTTGGKHGSEHDISMLARALGEMRTFEVAIGGGEPTMHPKFGEILRTFRYNGIIPNFTTKSTAWFSSKEIVGAVDETGGAFAYSVDSASEIAEVAPFLKRFGGKAHFQHVMGIDDSEKDFEKLLEQCAELKEHPITLLGYKNVGRGKSLTAKNYDWWLDVVERVAAKHYIRVGIDTALSSRYAARIAAGNISDRLYETQEGKFSMYIDAVARTCGPSSYAPTQMKSIGSVYENLGQNLLKQFASFA